MSDEIQPSRGGSEMRPRDSERGLVRRVVSIQGKKPYPGNYVPPRWQQRAGAEPIAAAAARAAAADRPWVYAPARLAGAPRLGTGRRPATPEELWAAALGVSPERAYRAEETAEGIIHIAHTVDKSAESEGVFELVVKLVAVVLALVLTAFAKARNLVT